MYKFKTGDKVIVTSGKDKGREGVIAKLYPKKAKALLLGINMYKKHVKKQLAADGQGGIYDLPRPLDWSKLAHIDPKTGKATRIGFDMKKDKKVRLSKKSSADIDAVRVPTPKVGAKKDKKTKKTK